MFGQLLVLYPTPLSCIIVSQSIFMEYKHVIPQNEIRPQITFCIEAEIHINMFFCQLALQ